jgi:DUF438 domain-containing protein
MRDENQEYIGVLEIVQDITNIKLLEGDRNELVYE